MEAVNTSQKRASRMELVQEAEELGRRRSIMPIFDLEMIWKRMDINGDGLIAYEEFCDYLKQMTTASLSENAIMNILKEIDVDGSGFIDYWEFMDFFSRVEDMDDLAARARFQSFFCSYFRAFYTFASVIALLIFCMMEINYNKMENTGDVVHPQTKELVKVGRICCIVNLSLSIFVSILMPVLRLKAPECLAKCCDCVDQMDLGRFMKRRRLKRRARRSRGVAPSPPKSGWQDLSESSPAAAGLKAAAHGHESFFGRTPPELPSLAEQELSYRAVRARPHSAPAIGRERSQNMEVTPRPARPRSASREVSSSLLSSQALTASRTHASRPPAPAMPSRMSWSPLPPEEPPPALMTAKVERKAGQYDPAGFALARSLQVDQAGPVIQQAFNPMSATLMRPPAIQKASGTPCGGNGAPHELVNSTWGMYIQPEVRGGQPGATYVD